MVKAPVYLQDHQICSEQLKNLRDTAASLRGQCPEELYQALCRALDDLESACWATNRLFRGTHPVGYGVDSMKKAVACDNIISIVKQIKGIKAW